MMRALQAAGARSVLATQWKVADVTTALLMESFYRTLRNGVARDEALRRAMVEVSSMPLARSPYHWAPFVLTGAPDRPLQFR
jgi:CHAT domain-containing protein